MKDAGQYISIGQKIWTQHKTPDLSEAYESLYGAEEWFTAGRTFEEGTIDDEAYIKIDL